MRIKARESLDRLKAMKNKKRKYVSEKEVDRETWTQIDVSDAKIGLRNDTTASRYVDLVAWANKNCVGNYSRADGSFWFEKAKDAFRFKLKWGEPDGK
jgi:hypothetical protein